MRIHRHVLLACVLACAHSVAAQAPVTLTPAEKAAAAVITPALLRAHVRFLSDGFFSCNGDRTLEAPKGIFDGHDGLAAQVVLNPGTPGEQVLPSKSSGRRLKKGDVIRVVGPNGGGYGDPASRDAAQVASDVADGLVSVDDARDVYRVAVDPASGALDADGTRRLRGAAQVQGK